MLDDKLNIAEKMARKKLNEKKNNYFLNFFKTFIPY